MKQPREKRPVRRVDRARRRPVEVTGPARETLRFLAGLLAKQLLDELGQGGPAR